MDVKQSASLCTGMAMWAVSSLAGAEENPTKPDQERPWFGTRLFNAYVDEFEGTALAAEEMHRRGLPSPWDARFL